MEGSGDNSAQLTNLLLWLVELGWNSTHPLLLVRIPENYGEVCMFDWETYWPTRTNLTGCTESFHANTQFSYHWLIFSAIPLSISTRRQQSTWSRKVCVWERGCRVLVCSNWKRTSPAAVGSNQLRVLVRDGLWRSESLPTAGVMLAQVDLVLQVKTTSWFWD